MNRIYLPILSRLGSVGTFYLVTGQITGVILGFFATFSAELWSTWKSAERVVENGNLLSENLFQNFLT